jgi:hypothetical protein
MRVTWKVEAVSRDFPFGNYEAIHRWHQYHFSTKPPPDQTSRFHLISDPSIKCIPLSIVNLTSAPIQPYHSAARPTNQELGSITAERIGVMQQPQVTGDRCIPGRATTDTRPWSLVYVLFGVGWIDLGCAAVCIAWYGSATRQCVTMRCEPVTQMSVQI